MLNNQLKGIKTILWCQDEDPLANWQKSSRAIVFSFQVQNGHVKRICDPDIQSNVLEIMGVDVKTTHLASPLNPKKRLGIKFPYLVLIIKNVILDSLL
jgi:hypothetical protein